MSSNNVGCLATRLRRKPSPNSATLAASPESSALRLGSTGSSTQPPGGRRGSPRPCSASAPSWCCSRLLPGRLAPAPSRADGQRLAELPPVDQRRMRRRLGRYARPFLGRARRHLPHRRPDCARRVLAPAATLLRPRAHATPARHRHTGFTGRARSRAAHRGRNEKLGRRAVGSGCRFGSLSASPASAPHFSCIDPCAGHRRACRSRPSSRRPSTLYARRHSANSGIVDYNGSSTDDAACSTIRIPWPLTATMLRDNCRERSCPV